MNKQLIKTGIAWSIGAVAGAMLIRRVYEVGMAYYTKKAAEQEVYIVEEESL